MTLTEFLLARIAEDESEANTWRHHPGKVQVVGAEVGELVAITARVLAECSARRYVMELHTPGSRSDVVFGGQEFDASECPTCHLWVGNSSEDLTPELDPCRTLRALSLPYADHPDYDEEWKP